MDSTSVSLLKRLKSEQSDEAWERFVEIYAPLIYYWAADHGMDKATAADLVQEVMAKLVVKMHEFKYDPKQRFRGWLRTVVGNQARDMQRRAKTQQFVVFDPSEMEQQAGPDHMFEEAEYRSYLVQRVGQLIKKEFDQRTWDACWMYVGEGLTAQEVAKELGITVNMVRLAKFRVFRRLRQELWGLLE